MKYSDFDICIDNQSLLQLSPMAQLEEDFAESYLPIKIDISDYSRISDDFKKVIEQNHIELSQSPRQ